MPILTHCHHDCVRLETGGSSRSHWHRQGCRQHDPEHPLLLASFQLPLTMLKEILYFLMEMGEGVKSCAAKTRDRFTTSNLIVL